MLNAVWIRVSYGIHATNLKKYNKVQYFCCILDDLPIEGVWGRVPIFELQERGGSQFSGLNEGKGHVFLDISFAEIVALPPPDN